MTKVKKKSDDDSLIGWIINFLKEKSIKYDDTTFLIVLPRKAEQILSNGFGISGEVTFFISKDTLMRRFIDEFTKSFAEPSPEKSFTELSLKHSSYETYHWFNNLLRWTNDSTTYKLHGVTQKEWLKIKPWLDAQRLTFNMHNTTILEIHDNKLNKE